MDNIVSLGSDRPKPYRAFDVPPSGARILFFTGVRYCRDREDEGESADARRGDPRGADAPDASLRVLDAAAH